MTQSAGAKLFHCLRSSGQGTDAELLESFARTGDGSAFRALVGRHGPMVLGVCRRVLRHSPDADDAFQATFLVLARKAGSLTRPERIAGWLYGVAYRTAVKARRAAARRYSREGPLAEEPFARPVTDAADRELLGLLDAAVGRLACKYREPVVLCHFEGRTLVEAAAILRCPPNTVATRLARARQQLRASLSRHALVLPTGAALALPPSLADAAVRVAGGAEISTCVQTLTEGVLRTMFLASTRTIAAGLAVAAAIGAGVWGIGARATEPPTPRSAVSPTAEAPLTAIVPEAPPDAPLKAEVVGNTCRTQNFLVEAPTAEIAERVAGAAEKQRTFQSERWTGRVLPPWAQPCPVRVTITPGGSGGATTFDTRPDGCIGQSMHLEGPLEKILDRVLPHEVTHTVVIHHLGFIVPRWADEGMAVLAEDATERGQHDELARRLVNEGRAMSLRRLLEAKEYPRDAMVLFAQGYSVVKYLTTEMDDRPTFVAFLAEAHRVGWDKALQRYYRFAGVDDLERCWLAWVRKTNGPLTAPDPPRVQKPAAVESVPPPAQGSDDVNQARDAYLAAMKRRADEVRKEFEAKQAELRSLERQIELLDPKRNP